MPQPQRLALEWLIQQCAQSQTAACRELLRRAICAHNDRAWDAMVPHLRAFLLGRIYAQRPEVSPQVAEQLILHALGDFLTQLQRQPNLARHFPTYPALLTMLGHSLSRELPHNNDG